jgi:ribosomal protein S18 acetylase RimI-like enzyme
MSYHIRDARVEDTPALADTVIEPIVTTFRGLVPDQCLSWITRDESIANWQRWFWHDRHDGQFLLVAELINAGVVGCALGGPQIADPQFAGELYLLGVLPAYQGQGIGRNLVAAVAARLSRQGIQSMQVRVLSINPNRHFYERLGAQYVGEQPYDWNGVLFTEALYHWPDITCLLISPVS